MLLDCNSMVLAFIYGKKKYHAIYLFANSSVFVFYNNITYEHLLQPAFLLESNISNVCQLF